MKLNKTIKHKLELDFEFDYQLIGICTHHNDYRLAFEMNQQFDISLAKSDELIEKHLKSKKEEHVFFPFYQYIDENSETSYILVKNKNINTYLVSEKPSIDFFFIVRSFDETPIRQLIDQMKMIQIVIGAYDFDPYELESMKYIEI